MKVLQVLAGGARGGAETAFVDTCIAMKNAGWNIEVVTRANDVRVPALVEAGINVHALPFAGKLDFWTGYRMKQIIKRYQPDIIQTWMSRASYHTPRWSKSLGIPQYLNVARLGGYYKLKYFKNTDYFMPITPDIKSYLSKEGVPEERLRCITNFAEMETFEAPAKRSDYKIPDDAPLLLSLGRLHHAKAFDTLIKVVAKMSGVYLWIAGEGPLREELEDLIQKLNVQDRVILLGWRSDRAALFQASDICVFPSRYEPFGTVFVQAWAQETPLVTTASDGPRQFVRHEDDCLLVDIDHEEQMRAAIDRLIKDKDLSEKLVRNGKERYLNEFTKEKTLEAYKAYFQDMRKAQDLET